MILEKSLSNDTQLGRVFNVMKDKHPRSLHQIRAELLQRGYHDSETAVSARLRQLRTEGYTVETQRGNPWMYRLGRCSWCKGRGFGAYLSSASGLDDHCPVCDGTGLEKR